MALLWTDSFGYLNAADLAEKYADVQPIMSLVGTNRRGGQALYANNFARLQTPPFVPTPNPRVIVGFCYKPANFNGIFFSILSGSSVQLNGFVNNVTGLVNIDRNGTFLGVSSIPVVNGVSVFVDMVADIHPSAGTVTLRFNENPVLTLTGVNTAATGVASWDAVRLGTSSTAQGAYSDFYVLDGSGPAPLNGLIGDCRVDPRYPTAAGATTGWTPSAGSNWQNVDDPLVNDDTDYNSAASAPLTDTFVVQDAPIPGATFYGVQQTTSFRKSDAGTCSVAPVVRPLAADIVGATAFPGVGYGYVTTVYGVNPATGLKWTESEFNAAEFGYKRLT